MTTADWMKECWDHIKSREIWRVILPGTHNSGVFSAWNTIAVRNQDKNIGEQLDGGIRAFDIRVMKGHGTYVMHHDIYYPPDDSQHLIPALDQIAAFVAAHDHEVLVINLSAGAGSDLTVDDYPGVRQTVLDRLESKLIAWNPYGSYTLESIHATGKNIVLISAIGKEPGKEVLFWDAGEDFMKSTWDGFQSDFWITPDEKIGRLKPHVYDGLRNPPKRFLWADCEIWTINIYNAASAWTNPNLPSWFNEWASDSQASGAMNIFGVDFFEAPDNQIVNTIVALNGAR
jgi:hypothetical protein